MGTVRAGFTTRASCLIAAGLTAVLCGLVLGEIDLVRAGVLAVALPCAAAAVVYRSRVRIANRRAVEPARAAAGDSVSIHLTITNRSVLPTGALMLEDQLPEQLTGRARFVLDGLSGRESRTVSYRMPALPRGRYHAGPLRFRITDPFHLVDVTRSFTATSEFIVTPIIDRLPAAEPPRSYDVGENAGSHSIGTHGADDASTREYRTGDDLRKIHWRSSARMGNLMVRQEERPWQGQTTLLVDLRACAHVESPQVDPDDNPGDARGRSSLEWAISATASIGAHLLMAGREVGLVSDIGDPHRLRPPDPVRLAEYLGGVTASRYADLSPLAGLARGAGRDSALVAVLGSLDPASLRMLADIHPRGSSIPAFALLLDTATWREPDLPRLHSEAEASARVLRAAGWRVVVVRRGDTTAGAWQLLLRSRAGNGFEFAATESR